MAQPAYENPFLGKYNIFCSSVPASTRAQKLIRDKDDRQNLHQRSGAGGVLLAVHNRWQPEASMHLHTHSQEPWLASHAIGVTASNSSGASCNIFGVYMPAEVRQQIYNHLKKHATQANTILLGDWNADPERPKLTTADHMHRHFLLSHLNFGSVGACRPTFHSSQAEHYFSSLDHIILRKDLSGFEHHLQALDSSGSSDHSPLLMQLLHPDLLRVPEEEPSPPFRSSLVHPVPKNALHEFKDAATRTLAATLGQMAEPSSLVTSSALEEHICHLHSILSSDAMQLARDTLPFTKEKQTMQKPFLSRCMARRLKQLIVQRRCLQRCRLIYQQFKGSEDAGLVKSRLEAAGQHLIGAYTGEDCPCPPPAINQLQDLAEVLEAWRLWNFECRRQIDKLKSDRAELRHEHAVQSREAARSSFQCMFDTNQARANKIINNQGSKGSSVRALLNDQGQLVTSLDGRLDLARAFYQKLATVPEVHSEGPLPWMRDLTPTPPLLKPASEHQRYSSWPCWRTQIDLLGSSGT